MFEHTLIGIMLVLITTLPLAWKWQLGMRRIALLVILLALLSGLIVTFLENLISINVLIRAGLVWLICAPHAGGGTRVQDSEPFPSTHSPSPRGRCVVRGRRGRRLASGLSTGSLQGASRHRRSPGLSARRVAWSATRAVASEVSRPGRRAHRHDAAVCRAGRGRHVVLVVFEILVGGTGLRPVQNTAQARRLCHHFSNCTSTSGCMLTTRACLITMWRSTVCGRDRLTFPPSIIRFATLRQS